MTSHKLDLPKEEIIERYKSGEPTTELADTFDCGTTTINRRLEDWGIERRSSADYKRADLPKKEVIKRYKGGESPNEIAESFNVHGSTVRGALERWGVELKDKGAFHRVNYATFRTKPQKGYEIWDCRTSEGMKGIFVHRLLAVSEYGIEAVKDNVVHHKNKIPWDNRPENIEVMSNEEHMSHHMSNKSDEWWEARERDERGRLL